jgi:hypothetical protein
VDAIVDALTPPFAYDQTAAAEIGEALGDHRLFQRDDCSEFSDIHRTGAQRTHNRQTRRIGQRPKQVGDEHMG